jgi:hypothetical protein
VENSIASSGTVTVEQGIGATNDQTGDGVTDPDDTSSRVVPAVENGWICGINRCAIRIARPLHEM